MRFNLYVDGSRTTVNFSDHLYDLFSQVMIMSDKASTPDDIYSILKDWLQRFFDAESSTRHSRTANNFLRLVVSAYLYGFPVEYGTIYDYYKNGYKLTGG